MILFGLVLMGAGFLGFVFTPENPTVGLVMGGFGFFLVLVAAAWLAIK